MTWFEVSHYDVDGPCPCPGCTGKVYCINEGSCTCFISPPCFYCTDSEFSCTKCDWDSRFEYIPKAIDKPQKSSPADCMVIIENLKILADNDFAINSVCFGTGKISISIPLFT